MPKMLHVMIRVTDLAETLDFFTGKLDFQEISREDNERGRYTNVFIAPPGDEDHPLELTYNWDPEAYTGGRNFGHVAYGVRNIHEYCAMLVENGVAINRPPRDGKMAFIRTPDNISIELLQLGPALTPAEPWISMPNVGDW